MHAHHRVRVSDRTTRLCGDLMFYKPYWKRVISPVHISSYGPYWTQVIQRRRLLLRDSWVLSSARKAWKLAMLSRIRALLMKVACFSSRGLRHGMPMCLLKRSCAIDKVSKLRQPPCTIPLYLSGLVTFAMAPSRLPILPQKQFRCLCQSW